MARSVNQTGLQREVGINDALPSHELEHSQELDGLIGRSVEVEHHSLHGAGVETGEFASCKNESCSPEGTALVAGAIDDDSLYSENLVFDAAHLSLTGVVTSPFVSALPEGVTATLSIIAEVGG